MIDEKEQTSTKSLSNVDNVSLFEELSSAEAPTSSQETRKDEQTDMVILRFFKILADFL